MNVPEGLARACLSLEVQQMSPKHFDVLLALHLQTIPSLGRDESRTGGGNLSVLQAIIIAEPALWR